MISCSRTVPRTVKAVTICDDVCGIHFKFIKLWTITLLLGIFSRAGPQIVKVSTVPEVVCGLHFTSFKCGSSESKYWHHFYRSMKWTMNRQDGRDFYFFSSLFNIFPTLPTSSTNISKHTKYTRF